MRVRTAADLQHQQWHFEVLPPSTAAACWKLSAQSLLPCWILTDWSGGNQRWIVLKSPPTYIVWTDTGRSVEACMWTFVWCESTDLSKVHCVLLVRIDLSEPTTWHLNLKSGTHNGTTGLDCESKGLWLFLHLQNQSEALIAFAARGESHWQWQPVSQNSQPFAIYFLQYAVIEL